MIADPSPAYGATNIKAHLQCCSKVQSTAIRTFCPKQLGIAWHSSMQHSTAQRTTAWDTARHAKHMGTCAHVTAQRSTAQHRTAQHSTTLKSRQNNGAMLCEPPVVFALH